MSDEILSIFIGYDAREDVAYRVCQASIERRSSKAVHIQPLNQDALRRMGVYRRAASPGTWRDSADGKPFSTEFSFSRFLVPALTQWTGWALFMDCDMLVTRDISELFDLRDVSKAVMVVKHDHRPKEGWKMDGVDQTVYPRKNWSSVMLWNCHHPSNLMFGIDDVNNKPGSWLHGFGWLAENEIGELPKEWNWLEGWDKPGETLPAIIHYTRGGPWFQHWRHVDYADLWVTEREGLSRDKPE